MTGAPPNSPFYRAQPVGVPSPYSNDAPLSIGAKSGFQLFQASSSFIHSPQDRHHPEVFEVYSPESSVPEALGMGTSPLPSPPRRPSVNMPLGRNALRAPIPPRGRLIPATGTQLPARRASTDPLPLSSYGVPPASVPPPRDINPLLPAIPQATFAVPVPNRRASLTTAPSVPPAAQNEFHL